MIITNIRLFALLFFQVDPFHTLFGIAGLSLMGNTDIKDVNPVFCMPEHVIQKLRVNAQILSWVTEQKLLGCIYFVFIFKLSNIITWLCTSGGDVIINMERWCGDVTSSVADMHTVVNPLIQQNRKKYFRWILEKFYRNLIPWFQPQWEAT